MIAAVRQTTEGGRKRVEGHGKKRIALVAGGSREDAKAGGVAAAWFVFALLRVSHGLDGSPPVTASARLSWLGCGSVACLHSPAQKLVFRAVRTPPEHLVDRFSDTGLVPEQTLHRQVWASEC